MLLQLFRKIEEIVEKKINVRKEILTTKEDILNFKVDVERRFNQMIIWTVSMGVAVVGPILTFLKF